MIHRQMGCTCEHCLLQVYCVPVCKPAMMDLLHRDFFQERDEVLLRTTNCCFEGLVRELNPGPLVPKARIAVNNNTNNFVNQKCSSSSTFLGQIGCTCRNYFRQVHCVLVIWLTRRVWKPVMLDPLHRKGTKYFDGFGAFLDCVVSYLTGMVFLISVLNSKN